MKALNRRERVSESPVVPKKDLPEDLYVELKNSNITESSETSDDSYFVMMEDTQTRSETLAVQKKSTRSRSKSYTLAVKEIATDEKDDYIPMDKNVNVSRKKPVPAPRPKDLDQKLAYERERRDGQMFKQSRSPIIPSRVAPPLPGKPDAEIIEKYLPQKSAPVEMVVNEKVTVIKEDVDHKERTITKVKERPKSSTWYDTVENDQHGKQTTTSEISDLSGIHYVEVDEIDKTRPQSAYVDSSIKLPTRKKPNKSFLGGSLLDTIRSWTGGSTKSGKGSDTSLNEKRNSTFYPEPEYTRSTSRNSDQSESDPPTPLPRTPRLQMHSPLPSSPELIVPSFPEKSHTTPPPIPPPRLSRSKESFEKSESFDEKPILPKMPSSISSDTGLDLIAKASRVSRLVSDNIPEDKAPPVPSPAPEKAPQGEDNTDSVQSHEDHSPEMHSLPYKRKPSLRVHHNAVPESTHAEEFDSLDVFIPPIEQQRFAPRKNKPPPDKDPSLMTAPTTSSQKKAPSVEDLDMVVHQEAGLSEDEDSGYALPAEVDSDAPKVQPRGSTTNWSDGSTPPALPPRDRVQIKARPVVLPPSQEHAPASFTVTAIPEPQQVYISSVYSEIGDTTVKQHGSPTPVPKPRPRYPNRDDIYAKASSGSTCEQYDSKHVTHDSDCKYPPPLPTTSPPRELLSHSDLETSPDRTISSEASPERMTCVQALSDSVNSNLDTTKCNVYDIPVPQSQHKPSVLTADLHVASDSLETKLSKTNYDLEIKQSKESNESVELSTSDSPSCDSSDTDSSGNESDCSSSSSTHSNAATVCATVSCDSTPVIEDKYLLDSILGDRASVVTLTPTIAITPDQRSDVDSRASVVTLTNDRNSPLPHLSTEGESDTTEEDDDASSSENHDSDSEPGSSTNADPHNRLSAVLVDYLNEPVRLRRPNASKSGEHSPQPLSYASSSESGSRPGSWASYQSFGSSDYSPAYTPQVSTLSSECPRPISGESGVASDLSVTSEVTSRLSDMSMTGSATGSVDSGQCGNEELTEEEKEHQQLEKRKRKCFYVAREIMTSEQTFVDVLKLLNKDYRKVIAQSSKSIGQPVVPPQVLNQILNHLPELHMFSQTLLDDLKKRIENWNKDPRIADIFVKKGPFLKLYTAYIANYGAMSVALDDARKKYVEFDRCTSVFEASTICSKLTLRHYMLKPVQRIPQYRLLLQDYKKYLTEDSPDYTDTEVALKIVTEVAEHANERMKYGENVNKLLEVQNKLVGRYEIIKPGRCLLKEGMLNKVSRKELQPRMFFLMNDVLLYTAPYTYNTFQLKNVLPLVGMRIRLPENPDDDHENEFSILSTQRSFTVKADSSEEKEEWVSALRSIIEENNDKRKTFVPTTNLGEAVISSKSEKDSKFKLGLQHPVWIPDDRVSMCMLCSAEFTLIFRRHHCRGCGQVVCLYCSDYKAPLQYLQNKPSRVCRKCYSRLKKDVRASLGASVGGAEEVDDSSVGLLSLFSKSASTLRKTAHKQITRVTQLRGSFGATGNKKTSKPKHLKEAKGNDPNATINGFLKCWKDKKWVRNWYVVKGNVLYTFKGCEDTAAVNSSVLLGYEVLPYAHTFQGVSADRIFELIHQGMPSLMFCSDGQNKRDQWMKAVRDATVPV